MQLHDADEDRSARGGREVGSERIQRVSATELLDRGYDADVIARVLAVTNDSVGQAGV